MSAANGLGGEASTATTASWSGRLVTNGRRTMATLFRAPRHRLAPLDRERLAIMTALAVLAVAGCMYFIDPWSPGRMVELPAGIVFAFGRVTDFGLAGYFLWPIGLVLIALAMLDFRPVPRFPNLVLAAWSARLGFVFVAIAVTGIFGSLLKHVIGRARPYHEGNLFWNFNPFTASAQFASFPSGHAITAFAALVAIGALLPQARALLWIYAILIALSRVVIMAHHPSDVIAGAIVGAVGALLVRNWFAARGLAFTVDRNGAVRPMPGPSMKRIGQSIGWRVSAAWTARS